MWDRTETLQSEDGWQLLPENQLGALIGWCAGIENLRRRITDSATFSSRMVRVETIRGGVSRKELIPFTASDQADVDESINEDLRNAGIPPRPSGYDWFIRIPEKLGSQLDILDVVNEKTAGLLPQAATPSDWKVAMDSIMDDIYK